MQEYTPLPLKQNTLEEKRVNIELDIEGEKIPCVREKFEYPENIKNETKIEGYTKFKIKWEDLEEFLKDKKSKLNS